MTSSSAKQEVITALTQRMHEIESRACAPANHAETKHEQSADCCASGYGVRANPVSQRCSDEESSPADALQRIARLASVRERSRAELSRRLKREGYSDECIALALEKACRYGIVDDRRFADALIRTRLAQGKGKAGIARELASNGIEPSEGNEWPYASGEHERSEQQRARDLLDRKPPRAKNLRAAAYRKLVVNGYSIDVARRVALAWCSERER